MSNSSAKDRGEVQVRSKLGPIRIELLDHQLNRHALGFGELSAQVPAGLYTLQYSAGTARDEEILRVEPGRTVTREVDLPFPAVAPISVSTTTHEFHTGPAQRFSYPLKRNYGAGGGLMIFARTIDADGRAAVPIEQLSLLDAELQPVGDLAADAERHPNDGWACLSARVKPGGYALRWHTPEMARRSRHGGEARPVDQSLWVSTGWLTMVFIGYRSESGQLERQSASIHMARLGLGFQPGPDIRAIRNNQVSEWDLKEARINQALDLALGGLRTGNLIVPDDLLDLLLGGKFQNPMLGIVGAHALLQRRTRDWKLFDVVVQNLEKLIPGHPDVAALRLCGKLLRGKRSRTKIEPLAWPPMVYAGYTGLIERDWKEQGNLVLDESVAERAAAALLPESPWTCWLAIEERAPQPPRARPKISLPGLSHYIGLACDPETAPGRVVRRFAFAARTALPDDLFKRVADVPDPAVERVSRHIASLKEMGDEVDLSSLSFDDFRQLGLPVVAVEKALQVLMDAPDPGDGAGGTPGAAANPQSGPAGAPSTRRET